MNWRLNILSILILGTFAAFSFGYYKYYVAPKSQGIILFVVPGLSLDYLGQTETSGPDARLNLVLRSNRIAVVNNNTLQPYAINPVSIMSFVATGEKGLPNQLGLDAAGNRLDNLLYKAQRAGRTTGIIGSSSVISPPLAAFYSHVKNAGITGDLARQLFDSTKINVILGGGEAEFTSPENTGGRNLLKEADLNGYRIIHSRSELEDIPAWTWWRNRRLLGLFAKHQMPYYDPMAEESAQNCPTLTDMTRRAIQLLEMNLNGYFLIVHHGLIAEASGENNIPKVISEIRELDRAIQEARLYSGRNTLIMLYCPYEVHPPLPAREEILLSNPHGRSRNGELLVFLGPYRPRFKSSLGFGWLSVYKQTQSAVDGFISPGDLSHFIEKQL